MNHYKKGFTLIELMLAMSFISVLLIAIAMTVIQISNIYNRGLTLKEVNQAGRSLTSELHRSVALSSSFPIIGDDSKFIKQAWGGRLCLGQYSYIWNYGTTLAGTPADGLSNVYASGSTKKVRFVKALDSTGEYCSDSSKRVVFDEAVELLDVGDRDLALHSFDISTAPSASDSKTRQSLYYITFVVGTNDQTAIAPSGTTTVCKPPSDLASDINYCSVNQFDLVARTGNTVQ